MLDELGVILQGSAELARSLSVDEISSKGKLDFVTNIDLQIDAHITAALQNLTPGVPVLTEERLDSSDSLSGEFWIVDPIDGTHNLVFGVPHVAISVALIGVDGTTKLGGAVDLHRQDIYMAKKGEGAKLNGARLQMPSSAPSLFALSTGAIDGLHALPQSYEELRGMGKWRNFGSQVLHLCFVARGHVGLALSQEARIWDDAAGRLIATEAGARYMSFAQDAANDLRAGAALRSVCAHSEIFDKAKALMTPVWQ